MITGSAAAIEQQQTTSSLFFALIFLYAWRLYRAKDMLGPGLSMRVPVGGPEFYTV